MKSFGQAGQIYFLLHLFQINIEDVFRASTVDLHFDWQVKLDTRYGTKPSHNQSRLLLKNLPCQSHFKTLTLT